MRKRLKQLMAAVLCLTGCTPSPQPANGIQRWAVYYNNKLPAEAFASQDLVVFDRRYYPKFEKIQKRTIVLAYISAGEVYDDVPEKKLLEKDKLLLKQDKTWKSHAVDLTAPQWRSLVLGQVDDAAKKGFRGVMLDTIESPIHWADTQAPERADAMREGAVMLIEEIRHKHPRMKIMLNRGFDILPAVASKIDYVLAESIMVQTDVSAGQFSLFSPMTYAQVATQLRHATTFAPRLQVLTLDYWNQDDVHGLERIYATQRASGFIPYVTTPDLRHFTPEPAPAGMPADSAGNVMPLKGKQDA